MSDITRLLGLAQQGDPRAAEELLPLVHEELRKLAAAKMAHEKPGQTLQPTVLVHEAWLRLAGSTDQHWQKRRHFIGAPGTAMAWHSEDNADAHLKRQIMGREVVVAITQAKLGFGPWERTGNSTGGGGGGC